MSDKTARRVSAGPYTIELPPNGVATLYEADAGGNEHQLPGGVGYLDALVQFAGEVMRLHAMIEAIGERNALQPIVSAPRDGTWILGWSRQDSAPYRISWGRNHNGQLAWCSAAGSFVCDYITDWMPLPNAPEAAP